MDADLACGITRSEAERPGDLFLLNIGEYNYISVDKTFPDDSRFRSRSHKSLSINGLNERVGLARHVLWTVRGPSPSRGKQTWAFFRE
jgi:hypothetical protein